MAGGCTLQLCEMELVMHASPIVHGRCPTCCLGTCVEGIIFNKTRKHTCTFLQTLEVHVLVHVSAIHYTYMRKGLGIFLENCKKLAATRD